MSGSRDGAETSRTPRRAELAMTLPSRVLEAAADRGGGKLVLVLGAGCSVEEPSCLPDSKQCSRVLWQELTDDRVLDSDDCDNPDDLSAVADAVWAKCGGQEELVKRLPKTFESAQPNEGTMLAAALLREHVVKHVVTLNVDMTLSAALNRVGPDDGIEILARPADHGQMGLRNVIYLHRNVAAEDPDTLVLRTEALEEQWKDGWEQVITRVALSTPVVVFAGLGSAVGVLIASASKMKATLGDAVRLFQVDIGNREDSPYAEQLGIADEAFVPCGWSNFMREVGMRVARAQARVLVEAAEQLVREEEVEQEAADALSERLAHQGLLYLGALRSNWTLDPAHPYRSAREVAPSLLADLLLGIAALERLTGAEAHFVENGLVQLRRDGAEHALVAVATGSGVKAWLSAEARLRNRGFGDRRSALSPSIGLLAHTRTSAAPVAAPENIVAEAGEEDIITGGSVFPILSLEELRRDPDEALALLKAA